jgi:glutathione S-transferase
MLELYHNDMSSCAQKVRAVLAEKGLKWSGPNLNLRAGDQHKPEFLKLNPKGVVPVLVHDGVVVTESNIIIEYIEDVFPQKSLMPGAPQDRAKVRFWLQKLDSGLHLAVAVLSIGVAFRDQLLAVNTTQEALEKFYEATPDPALRSIYQELVPAGVDAPQFEVALAAWMKCFFDMEKALQTRDYLAGDTISLADFGMLPYFCRFVHLKLDYAWETLPRAAAWFERMKQSEGYRTGIEEWFNPKYLELMGEKGAALLPRTTRLIDRIVKKLTEE